MNSTEPVETDRQTRSALDYYAEGIARGKEGRDDEALTLFTLALAVNPSLASAWTGRGFALGKLGRFQEEIECCDQALCLILPVSMHGITRRLPLENWAG